MLHTGVFYCGAPVLAQELNKLCHEFNGRSTTKFEFHKEHFWFQVNSWWETRICTAFLSYKGQERAQGGQAILKCLILALAPWTSWWLVPAHKRIRASQEGFLCTVTHNTLDVHHGLCSMDRLSATGEKRLLQMVLSAMYRENMRTLSSLIGLGL